MGHLNLTYGIDGYGKPVATVDHGGQHILVTVDILNNLLLNGGIFVATDYLVDLAAGAYRDFLITVGDTLGAHIGLTYSIGADGNVLLYRDTTHTGGAALTEFNRNQNYPDGCPYIVVTQGAAGGANGTLMFTAFIPGGTRDSSSPGGGRSWAFGWILEANTNYFVRVRNVSAAATPVSVQFDLHSHIA